MAYWINGLESVEVSSSFEFPLGGFFLILFWLEIYCGSRIFISIIRVLILANCGTSGCCGFYNTSHLN